METGRVETGRVETGRVETGRVETGCSDTGTSRVETRPCPHCYSLETAWSEPAKAMVCHNCNKSWVPGKPSDEAPAAEAKPLAMDTCEPATEDMPLEEDMPLGEIIQNGMMHVLDGLGVKIGYRFTVTESRIAGKVTFHYSVHAILDRERYAAAYAESLKKKREDVSSSSPAHAPAEGVCRQAEC